MNANLRILLLEDSLADAKLIERELSRDGFNFFLSRIHTESELRRELAAAPPDLVLSNHRLTELDGFRALAKASGVEPDSEGASAVGEEPQEEFVPQLFIPACGHLSLCPHCHQSRDE